MVCFKDRIVKKVVTRVTGEAALSAAQVVVSDADLIRAASHYKIRD